MRRASPVSWLRGRFGSNAARPINVRGGEMKRIALAFGAVALLALSAGSALAAPTGSPNARLVTAHCGTAGNFTMVAMGNGRFPAAHDLDSTRVFVPLAFGVTTVAGSDGSSVDYPAGIKGSAAPKGHPLIDCSWVGDPEFFEGVWYTASGTVTGFIA